MPLKQPHTIKKVDQSEADFLNRDLQILYESKIESREYNENGSQKDYIYQSIVHGQGVFSATGSATIVRSFGFQNKFNNVLYATAHARSADVTAHITDVTASGVSITLRDADSTAVISATITTGQITVYYQVVGSTP